MRTWMLGSTACPNAGEPANDNMPMTRKRPALARMAPLTLFWVGYLARRYWSPLPMAAAAILLGFEGPVLYAQPSGVDPNIGARIEQSLPSPADRLLNTPSQNAPTASPKSKIKRFYPKNSHRHGR